jgi:VWFA-related protein
MPEHLANPKQITETRLNSALLILAIILCAALIAVPARAQQTKPGAGGQQRPRKVGAGGATAQPSPAATPRPASPSAPAGEEVDDNDVVRVETQLVSVPAVVTDSAGRPLAGLRAENFAVYEDGHAQNIANFGTTDAPFEIALLLDTSGSTRADVALIRRAANNFIDALRPGDRVAIVAFNTMQEGTATLATVEVKTRLTSDRALLRKAVEGIGASNGTPFYDGLERIGEEVFREPPREEVRGRRAVVALTDGVDSASHAEFDEARAKLMRTGVACYFIEVNTEDFVEERLMRDCEDDGTLRLSRTQLQRYRRIFVPRAQPDDYSDFCSLGPFERMQISRSLYNLARREMGELAKASGGKTFVAADLREARAAFAQVAAEIGTQYSIGYYPTNKSRDGRFRAIRVEVKGVSAGAQVRARGGYYAPKS